MSHLLYLIFRYDFDVMENLKNLEELEGTKHSHEWTSSLNAYSKALPYPRLTSHGLTELQLIKPRNWVSNLSIYNVCILMTRQRKRRWFIETYFFLIVFGWFKEMLPVKGAVSLWNLKGYNPIVYYFLREKSNFHPRTIA